ncbi:MAG: hypothetical protein VR78_06305 [Hoeflea sp. BRH_c9]|nr:MAG: hypothetical protein VR78_06305 [Hoeflea sp. BRH_c9]
MDRSKQVSTWGLHAGWHRELVTAPPTARNGKVTLSDAPGLGQKLLPWLWKRADAIVRVSDGFQIVDVDSRQDDAADIAIRCQPAT